MITLLVEHAAGVLKIFHVGGYYIIIVKGVCFLHYLLVKEAMVLNRAVWNYASRFVTSLELPCAVWFPCFQDWSFSSFPNCFFSPDLRPPFLRWFLLVSFNSKVVFGASTSQVLLTKLTIVTGGCCFAHSVTLSMYLILMRLAMARSKQRTMVAFEIGSWGKTEWQYKYSDWKSLSVHVILTTLI